MDTGLYLGWNKTESFHALEDLDEVEELKGVSSLPALLQPQTPKESMEFLSRSWSLSASEISKALAHKQKHFIFDSNQTILPPETSVSPQIAGKVLTSINARKTGTIGKWFHQNKESNSSTLKKKDKIRAENARLHSAISVAGLAAGLAAVTASWSSNGSGSKMNVALASATELLAAHCVELAELAGAEHDRLASAVRSAVDVRSPGDLTTLTAAAATALRGEAALRSRLPKEARKNAAISPCERSMAEANLATATAYLQNHTKEQNPLCEGDLLLQHTQKGLLRWKHVFIYINKKSQVIVQLKSKNVGGAFSKKKKCVVYGSCDETSAWPYRKERENSEELYFGLKTGQGLLEFKCQSKIHKQRWVDGIQNLLKQATYAQVAEVSFESLNIDDTA